MSPEQYLTLFGMFVMGALGAAFLAVCGALWWYVIGPAADRWVAWRRRARCRRARAHSIDWMERLRRSSR